MAPNVIEKSSFLSMSSLPSLPLTHLAALKTRDVWAALVEAHRHMAEPKGMCEWLPKKGILLDTLEQP